MAKKIIDKLIDGKKISELKEPNVLGSGAGNYDQAGGPYDQSGGGTHRQGGEGGYKQTKSIGINEKLIKPSKLERPAGNNKER